MEIVKKNILSIVCGVVALVALVAAFYPLGAQKDEAQADLSKRAGLYSQLRDIRSRPRHLPTLGNLTAEAPLLQGFPTQAAIKKAQELQEKLAGEKAAVLAAAEEINRRPLLVPDSLPNAPGTTGFEFRDRYKKAIDDFAKAMGAGQPPSVKDIEDAKAELWKTQFEPKIIMQGGQRDPVSEADQKKAWEREAMALPEQDKYHRAEQIRVYIAPEAVQASAGINTVLGTAPEPKTMWYAQLNLWLQSDIANAILEANSGYPNVIKAPVKQWLSLRIDPYRREGVAGAMGVAGGGAPGMAMGPGFFGGVPGAVMPGSFPGTIPGPPPVAAAAAPAASTPSGPKYELSPTGRVCNPLYDVVPFTLVVDVQSSKIPAFLETLGRNRLITPTSVNIVPVDSNILLAAPFNFVYGSEPVARVTVAAEALYLRSWTEKLMPAEVKTNDLGIAPAAPAGGAAVPGR